MEDRTSHLREYPTKVDVNMSNANRCRIYRTKESIRGDLFFDTFDKESRLLLLHLILEKAINSVKKYCNFFLLQVFLSFEVNFYAHVLVLKAINFCTS